MKKLKSSLILVLTALIWGIAFVAQSKGMEYVGPLTYCAIRMLMGGIVLLPVIAVLDRKKTKEEREVLKSGRKTRWTGGFCCGVMLCVSSLFQQYGVKYTTVGKASFITALYIVIVPMMGLFLGKRISALTGAGVLMAVVGFGLLCLNGADGIQKGDWLVLICAFGFSVHILVIDYFSPKVDGIRMSCMQFLICGLLCLAGMFLFENPSLRAIWSCRLPLAYGGLMSCGVGYTLQIVGQKNISPTVASLILSLESVFGAMAGVVLLGENYTDRQAAGCVMIFVAVILAQLPELFMRKRE